MKLKDEFAIHRDFLERAKDNGVPKPQMDRSSVLRMLDFTDAAIPILECASAKDEPMGWSARKLLAKLDEEVG